MWIWIILAPAALKCVLGVLAFICALFGVAAFAPDLLLPGLSFAHVVVYSLAAGLLMVVCQRDRRALFLGGALLLIASSSSDRLYLGLSSSESPVLASCARVLAHIQPDVFIPLLLWLFFSEFPRGNLYGWARNMPALAIRLSAIVGIILFGLLGFKSRFAEPSAPSGPDVKLDLFVWTILIALIVPALIYGTVKTRAAPLGERRRLRLFLAGLGIGLGPMLAALLLEALIPPFARYVQADSVRRHVGMILHSFLITVPVTTAYSVVVHRVLEVGLYIRRAIQYALTRYALLTAAMIPFLVLAWDVYHHRDQTIRNLLTGSPLVLATVVLTGLVAFHFRGRVLRAIDRHFFREQYDSRQILTQLIEKCRAVRAPEELAGILCNEIGRALHLESNTVFIRDVGQNALRSPTDAARPLDMSSALAKLIAASAEPLDVDLESPKSTLHRLSREEREWLVDGACVLLVPLLASDGSLVGLLSLGEKKSELPFSAEDRSLLTAIACSAALTIENRMIVSSPRSREQDGTPVSRQESQCRESRRGSGDGMPSVSNSSARRHSDLSRLWKPGCRLPCTLCASGEIPL